MNRTRTRIALVTATLLFAGCSSTIEGTPIPAGSGGDSQFDKLLQECTAVSNDKIAESVQAGVVEQYFYGAVCMWTGTGTAGLVDVTFAWFENNSLGRERALAEQLNYAIEPVMVAGTNAFLSRRPGDPASCGITAAYTGTITWWVQYRGGAIDPCVGATKLAELTLQRNQ